MNWYKHDTNAATDAKIRKLILKYGAEGYAIYFHCLELIAADINENNITFELEHDSEIIADNLKIISTPECAAIDKVNKIMQYIVELNLFQESEGRIFCFKMLKRLDASMTSSKKFREFIQKAKENHDSIMINTDSIMQEEIRRDKNKLEDNKKGLESFDTFWTLYNKKINRDKSFKKWCKIKPDLHDTIFNHVKEYVLNTPDIQFRKNPLTYLNNECWNDEIIKLNKEESKELSLEEKRRSFGI